MFLFMSSGYRSCNDGRREAKGFAFVSLRGDRRAGFGGFSEVVPPLE